MITCRDDCTTCCDYCIHCEHKLINGMISKPIGCKLHKDKEHQRKAEGYGYCEDFHCFRVKEP